MNENGSAISPLFGHTRYLIRRKVFKVFGEAFHIYDENGAVVFYSKMKAFKLKEDIRLYTSENMQTEVLTIQARRIIDFGAAYDIVDAASGHKVGALKRRGFKSILRDEWIIMDAADNDIGSIKEDNMALALLRRFLTNLIPQTYEVVLRGKPVARFTQQFNPFILKMALDFSADPSGTLDRRLGIAGAVLIGAIEGRQN